MLKYKYILQIKYTEAILSNSTRTLLWFKISKMLIAVLKIYPFIVSFIYNFRRAFVPCSRMTADRHFSVATTSLISSSSSSSSGSGVTPAFKSSRRPASTEHPSIHSTGWSRGPWRHTWIRAMASEGEAAPAAEAEVKHSIIAQFSRRTAACLPVNIT